MKPKFEPDADPGTGFRDSALVDPEAYDASEQQFAASVEAAPARQRFVLEEEAPEASTEKLASEIGAVIPPALDEDHGSDQNARVEETDPASLQPDLLEASDPDSWRREVAARVDKYRARRRPRPPHYPSLQLKFDPPESSWTPLAGAAVPPAGRLSVAMQDTIPVLPETEVGEAVVAAQPHFELPEVSARILEFPRPAAPRPVFDELAEPVMDCPRILEVPDSPPPPPALGGIIMEPAPEPEKERRPGFELPLLAASLPRRLAAASIDGVMVGSAFALFSYIFFRVATVMPPVPQALETSAFLLAVFWTAYQYLLLVYTGATPGLKLAKLELTRFDGTRVPRTVRRCRVLASVLSALSLALGYAWCFLDEDRLCWHDRITHTYMAPQAEQLKPD